MYYTFAKRLKAYVKVRLVSFEAYIFKLILINLSLKLPSFQMLPETFLKRTILERRQKFISRFSQLKNYYS